MSMITLVQVGASQLADATSTPMIHAKGPDGEDYSSVNVYGTLGVTSLPSAWDPDRDGYTEYVMLVDENIAIAARDTRIADVVGELSPGDTAVHSTGPLHVSRLFLKEESRIAALLVKDTNGKDMGIMIDGTNKKIQIFGAGLMFELDCSAGTVSLGSATSNILLQQGKAILNSAQIMLGGAATAATPVTLGPIGQGAVGSTCIFGTP